MLTLTIVTLLVAWVMCYTVHFLRYDNYRYPDLSEDFWASLTPSDHRWLEENGLEVEDPD